MVFCDTEIERGYYSQLAVGPRLIYWNSVNICFLSCEGELTAHTSKLLWTDGFYVRVLEHQRHWSLLEMQIPRPHPRPENGNHWGIGLSKFCFNRPCRGFWGMLFFEKYGLWELTGILVVLHRHERSEEWSCLTSNSGSQWPCCAMVPSCSGALCFVFLIPKITALWYQWVNTEDVSINSDIQSSTSAIIRYWINRNEVMFFPVH